MAHKYLTSENSIFELAKGNNPLFGMYAYLKFGGETNPKYQDEHGRTLLHYFMNKDFYSGYSSGVLDEVGSQKGYNPNSNILSGDELNNIRLDVLKMLIQKGFSISLPDNYGVTPTEMAIKNSFNEFFEVLEKNKKYNTELTPDFINGINVKRTNYDYYNKSKETEMQTAINFLINTFRDSDQKILTYLLSQGLDINKIETTNSKNAFAYARNAETFEFLINNGCDVLYEDNEGSNAFAYAHALRDPGERDKSITLVKNKLKELQKNAKTGKILGISKNALFDAAGNSTKANFVKLVKSFKLDIKAADEQGKTPLHISLEKSKASIAMFLIDQGANIFAKDNDGIPAFMYGIYSKSGYRRSRNDLANLDQLLRTMIPNGYLDDHGNNIMLLALKLSRLNSMASYDWAVSRNLSEILTKYSDKIGNLSQPNNNGDTFCELLSKLITTKAKDGSDKISFESLPEEFYQNIILNPTITKKDIGLIVNNFLSNIIKQAKHEFENSPNAGNEYNYTLNRLRANAEALFKQLNRLNISLGDIIATIPDKDVDVLSKAFAQNIYLATEYDKAVTNRALRYVKPSDQKSTFKI